MVQFTLAPREGRDACYQTTDAAVPAPADSTTERQSSTEDNVAAAEAAVAVEVVATAVEEATDMSPCLTTLPPVVHPRTTRPAAASTVAGEE
jgi:hypothetical protein